MSVIETVYIGERERVVVSHDEYASDPREDDTGIVMFPVRLNKNYRTFLPGSPYDATWLLLEHLSEQYDHNSDEFVEAVGTFFNRLGIDHITRQFDVYRDHYGTYIMYGLTKDIRGDNLVAHAQELDAYINGSVYILKYEQKNSYASMADPDRVIEVWDEVEAVGGVYMDEFTIDNVSGYFDGITLNDMEVSK